jgi:arylsulfatase A-like enzyme
MHKLLSSLALLLIITTSCWAKVNVLVVITDDQGFGDLGLHGNPVIRTPNLDAFGKSSVQLKNFYVSPVCSPTRSSLMTGLYNYRTGVVDTYIGRSMMRPGEFPTLPELLAKSGYQTGLFGKWHLGDNYPMRPEDRGFQQTLWHHGGGIGQPSDPPEGSRYQDPVLVRNGQEVNTRGYCTDVFTDAAIDFIKQNQTKPFFAYVAYNCPHSPYQIAEDLVTPYKKLNLNPDGFPAVGQPWAAKKLNTDEIAKAYAMIENIDTNFARLLKTLDDLKIADDTLIIFLTDNGPGGVRFNGGLRNRKGTVYDGGIRVPCFVRWPQRWKAKSVDTPAAHIDLTPTVLQACSVPLPAAQDGRSLLPILDDPKANWAERTLYFQWHRGDVPERYRGFAARGPRYKLVQAAAGDKFKPQFELFDLQQDPFEQRDLSQAKPELVEQLKQSYSKWFDDVTAKGFTPPRIILGSKVEPKSRLTRQDWRGSEANWTPQSRGHFEVETAEPGTYSFKVICNSPVKEFRLLIGDKSLTAVATEPTKQQIFEAKLPKGPLRLAAEVLRNGTTVGAEYIEVERK